MITISNTLRLTVPSSMSIPFIRPLAQAVLFLALALNGTANALQNPEADPNIINVWPGPEIQERLQEALILVQPGQTILLGEGIFQLTDGLSLKVSNVTIQGAGSYRTILSFSEQETAGEGLQVEADNVILQDFAVVDTKADGIKAQNCKSVTVRRVRVEWTRGPHPKNGAYGVYPVTCYGVLIEDSTFIGASDAGIYVGQSEQIVVRNNIATHNVAGLEIENSYYADVYGNLLEHNTAGVLIFDLPDLPKQGGHHIRVFNNRSHNNDVPNFAAAGTIVAGTPNGIGIMIMANRDVEVYGNHMSGNASANMLIVGFHDEYEDKTYNPYPARIYIHSNRFGKGGFAPDMEKLDPIGEILKTPLPDIIWDGVAPVMSRLLNSEPAVTLGSNNLRLDGTAATFVNLDLVPWAVPVWSWFHAPNTNTEDYSGHRPPLAAVKLDF